jgi:uncharacterized repeat protein (TIGR03806 family)
MDAVVDAPVDAVVDAPVDAVVDAPVDAAVPVRVGYDSRPSNPSCVDPGVDQLPPKLSQTGCFLSSDPDQPVAGVIPFDLNAALWSDFAGKERWLALPDGTTITILPDGDFEFPVGTMLLKLFKMGDRNLETRFFIHHSQDVWVGYAYKWNPGQTDADLVAVDADESVRAFPAQGPNGELTWTIPSRADCMRCHNPAANDALGPELGQLNRNYLYPSGVVANQLDTWKHIGLFSASTPMPTVRPLLPPYAQNPDATETERARSYLHLNCGFCHRKPGGPGGGPDDLRANIPEAAFLASICSQTPTAGDLGVDGGLIVTPGDAEHSILWLRMAGMPADKRMPPLATAITYTVGMGIVRQWINTLSDCQ